MDGKGFQPRLCTDMWREHEAEENKERPDAWTIIMDDLMAHNMDMRNALDKIRDITIWRRHVKDSSLAHA